MSQGNDFANYAASSNGGGATSSGDVWFVAVASDDIKQMSIEQLDEAFRLGIINAETQVWTEGMEAWAPLGEVADLSDDDSGESSEHEARSEIGSGVISAPAFASSARAYDATLPGMGLPGAGGSGGAQSIPAAGPSSVAPVTASFAPSSPFVQSTVPVALNVDEDMPPVRVGRRFKPERWLLAAAAVVGLGVTAYNNSDLFASTPAPTAAAAAPVADSKPVSRGYDVGNDVSDGVEKGAALPTQPAKDEEKSTASDAPIGAGSSLAAKEAKETTKDKEEPSSAAPDKESLKGSFAKAFNKKAPSAKPAKAAKPRKTAKAAASKPAKAKKASTPKAASAFDPLNDSLP